jgi:hypothetical protein
MVIPSAVAYGVLVSVGLVVLVVFLVVFMRLERAPKRIEEDRPPTPVGWAIAREAAAPSAPSVASPAGRRDLESVAPQSRKGPS